MGVHIDGGKCNVLDSRCDMSQLLLRRAFDVPECNNDVLSVPGLTILAKRQYVLRIVGARRIVDFSAGRRICRRYH